jgi:pimeloyl-ACP methyl ester carboxylesterase
MVVCRRTGRTEIDSQRTILAASFLSFALMAAAAPAGAAVRRHACVDAPAGTRCGSISVPLDRSGAARGRLRIAFERYPRRDRTRPPAGTMLAIEGGPGYSTTDSRDSYLTLLAPLRARRDLLLVDLRGTGHSGALDCPALRKTVKDYVRRAGVCARELGARRDLYGTHAAVDDVAAVLAALRIGRVDLYGDSYGTFAAQAFAVHHGDRLRSLVLDGAYPVTGTDPAFSDLAEATQRALRLVCARRPSCAARGEDPIAVVARLVERLRAHRRAASASTRTATASACASTSRQWRR